MVENADGAQEVERALMALSRRLVGVDPLDLRALRRAYDSFSELDPVPPLAVNEQVQLGGVLCQGMMPEGASGERVIIWMHGGGFNLGSSRSHKGVASQVAAAARSTVVVPDFRRAPEFRHPAAIEDGVAVYRALLAEGVKPNRIVIAGDSAGAFIALAMALRIRAHGGPRPAGLMFLSPWVDLTNSGWSHRSKANRDQLLTRAGLDARAKLYLGEFVTGDRQVNLLELDLSDLPPAMIQVGEADILLSDATTLAERMGAAGSAVTLEIWPAMFHVFQARYPVLSHAQQAVKRLGAWAAAHLRN